MSRFLLKAKPIRVLLLSVLALASVVLLACQSQTVAPATATTAPAAATKAPVAAATQVPASPPTQAPAPAPATQVPAQAPQETLKVGVSSGLSGPGAANGLSTLRFMQLGIDELNGKGGIKVGGKAYRLEPVVADDKFAAEAGREAANKLVLGEKVRFIFGMAGSALAGGQAVIDQARVLVLAASAVDQSLGPEHPTTFAVGAPHVRSRSQSIYDWLAQDRPKVKRVAITYADTATGKVTAGFSGEMAKQRGLTVLATEAVPSDMKDFAPLVTRILRENPDGVEMMGAATGTQFVTFMQALFEQGYKGQVYGTMVDASMAKGLPYLEGYVAGGLVDWKASAVGTVRDIIERYIAKHGEQDQNLQPYATYNSAFLLAQAIEKAGTVEDTEKIAKVLRESEWDAPWSKELGKSRFVGAKTLGLASYLELPWFISAVEKGKVVTLRAMMATLP